MEAALNHRWMKNEMHETIGNIEETWLKLIEWNLSYIDRNCLISSTKQILKIEIHWTNIISLRFFQTDDVRLHTFIDF